MDVFFIKFGGGFMGNWLIDDKGRLFGKWNIIDFMVVVFLLCLTPMFWYAFKLFRLQPKTTIEIQIKEYEELKASQQQITDFLKKHKRARKYFE